MGAHSHVVTSCRDCPCHSYELDECHLTYTEGEGHNYVGQFKEHLKDEAYVPDWCPLLGRGVRLRLAGFRDKCGHK